MAETTGTTDTDVATRSDLSLIAHRGFAGIYPENTLAAVTAATADDGTTPRPDVVEVDVMPCADGDVVVFHDTELGRVTDAPTALDGQKVWETPYETLRKLDVLGTGEPIPRLREVLAVIPDEVGVNVEFKNPGSADVRFGENLPPEDRDRQRDRWLPFAERVLSVADEFGHDLLVSSFCEGALAAVREVDSSVSLAAVCSTSIADGLDVARRYDCEAVHPPWNMIRGTSLFNDEYGSLGPYEDRDLVSVAHDEGREVNAWTVERWYQAAELQRAGVDGLIADYPGVLQFDADTGTESGTETAVADERGDTPSERGE